MAGTLFKWLWEETHVLKVVSSNPITIYWMQFFTLIFCKICYICLKKTENKRKRSQEWAIFKIDWSLSKKRKILTSGSCGSRRLGWPLSGSWRTSRTRERCAGCASCSSRRGCDWRRWSRRGTAANRCRRSGWGQPASWRSEINDRFSFVTMSGP